MVAKPQHYVVDCPPSRPDGSWRQATPAPEDEEQKPSCCFKLCVSSLICVVASGLFAALMIAFHSPKPLTGDPVFSVAVAGVAGLDPARDFSPPAPLSPVFNLTFHIDNTRNSQCDACVPGLSTAEVSYGNAFLAKGSVPPFCAKGKQESEHTPTRVWGDAVAVPRFLRDQLAGELGAGEAEVDVKVTMPRYSSVEVLSCKAKIGGGASPPCRLDYLDTHDHSRHHDD